MHVQRAGVSGVVGCQTWRISTGRVISRPRGCAGRSPAVSSAWASDRDSLPTTAHRSLRQDSERNRSNLQGVVALGRQYTRHTVDQLAWGQRMREGYARPAAGSAGVPCGTTRRMGTPSSFERAVRHMRPPLVCIEAASRTIRSGAFWTLSAGAESACRVADDQESLLLQSRREGRSTRAPTLDQQDVATGQRNPRRMRRSLLNDRLPEMQSDYNAHPVLDERDFGICPRCRRIPVSESAPRVRLPRHAPLPSRTHPWRDRPGAGRLWHHIRRSCPACPTWRECPAMPQVAPRYGPTR